VVLQAAADSAKATTHTNPDLEFCIAGSLVQSTHGFQVRLLSPAPDAKHANGSRTRFASRAPRATLCWTALTSHSPVLPSSFRCTACGNCCRDLRVAVTALDVARLASATGVAPAALVDWLGPDAVDMIGEPDSFVELSEGRRLMVLRQVDGACTQLGADNRCRAYAARPRDCRAFPFDFSAPPASQDAPRRLVLLPLQRCDYALDGANDEAALALEDQTRWDELSVYRALVARWNRRAWHRRRLHRSAGDTAAFLAFAIPCLPPGSPRA
jgi:Fe-S-cluster containining protein